MFKSARVKIAVWFVLAIVIISLLFSFLFYRTVARDMNNRYANIEIKIQNNIRSLDKVPPVLKTLLRNDLRIAKQRIIFLLLLTNGGIFLISVIIGFFLAGRALQPIEQMVEEQKRFISNASHELRTPISIIKTSTEVALRKKQVSPDEAREILKDNLKDLENLEILTERLLQLSHYQEGLKVLSKEKLDLGETLKNIYEKIIHIAEKKNIKLNLEAENAFIYADRMSIEELVIILFDNAYKYTPEGGTISLNVFREGRHVVLKVTDSGEGITKEDIRHIFDRFYRAESSRSKQKIPGFGLGLALANKIVRLQDGSIHAASILGKGSTFKVIFPSA